MPEDNKMKEIRWRQRFQNFEKAYERFKEVLKTDTEHDQIMRAALINTYEFLFELAWKTMKDKLEAEGFPLTNPRDTIKQAYGSGYFTDGKVWMKALDTRNELVHNYDEQFVITAEREIRSVYASLFEEIRKYFKQSL